MRGEMTRWRTRENDEDEERNARAVLVSKGLLTPKNFLKP